MGECHGHDCNSKGTGKRFGSIDLSQWSEQIQINSWHFPILVRIFRAIWIVHMFERVCWHVKHILNSTVKFNMMQCLKSWNAVIMLNDCSKKNLNAFFPISTFIGFFLYSVTFFMCVCVENTRCLTNRLQNSLELVDALWSAEIDYDTPGTMKKIMLEQIEFVFITYGNDDSLFGSALFAVIRFEWSTRLSCSSKKYNIVELASKVSAPKRFLSSKALLHSMVYYIVCNFRA